MAEFLYNILRNLTKDAVIEITEPNSDIQQKIYIRLYVCTSHPYGRTGGCLLCFYGKINRDVWFTDDFHSHHFVYYKYIMSTLSSPAAFDDVVTTTCFVSSFPVEILCAFTHLPLVLHLVVWPERKFDCLIWRNKGERYRKISNIRRAKSKNLNVSCLGLKLLLRDILKPNVKWRKKIKWDQRRQAMFQQHLSDQQWNCLLKRTLY